MIEDDEKPNMEDGFGTHEHNFGLGLSVFLFHCCESQRKSEVCGTEARTIPSSRSDIPGGWHSGSSR